MQSSLVAAKHRGALSYQAGKSGEAQVVRHYEALGFSLVAQRWRGQGGEVDAVFRKAAQLVFVEVKASTTHAKAAAQIKPAQLYRIAAAAEEYADQFAQGNLTHMRIDAALVDAQGYVDVLENVLIGA